MMNQEICVTCKKQLEKDEFVTLGEKGSAGIDIASEERGDTIKTVAGQKVHKICRRDYCLAQNILRSKRQTTVQGATQNIRRSLERKEESSFSFKTDCFYCGTEVKFDGKKGATSGFKVTTIETKNTVLEICSKRGNDSWAEIVRGRLLHVHDLPAADAIYHQACSVNFRTETQIPKIYGRQQPECKRGKIGRPRMKKRLRHL
jgi:predicted secreted protein